MLAYYIKGLAELSGYASWVLLILAIIYSCYISKHNAVKGEYDELDERKRSEDTYR